MGDVPWPHKLFEKKEFHFIFRFCLLSILFVCFFRYLLSDT